MSCPLLSSSGLATDNQPQLVAIREALVNLLMHSDYFSSMKPRIRVFTDRIEFMNPGGLPKDLESIMKEDFTQPGNPIIARVFRVLKLAESAGSGFEKMFSGWQSHYKNTPEVEGGLDFYKITFCTRRTAVETVKKGGQKISLTSRQADVLHLIQDKPDITRKEMADSLQINESAIQKHIEKLKEKGVIERIGSDRGGHWKTLVDKV